MAFTAPVTLVFSLVGDGESTVLTTFLGPLFIGTGLPGTTIAQRLLSISSSDGSAVTATVEGQTLVSTFPTAPADAAVIRLTVNLGV